VKNKSLGFLCVSVCFAIISTPLAAHHGRAVFDMDHVTVLKATVTRFEFMNPHTLIYFDVTSDKGAVEHWIAETNSNNHLSRGGYDKNSVKPGEQVIITGHRAKNGANSLELQCPECSVTDLQGKVLLGYYF